MSEGSNTVATWPLIEVTIHDDGRAEIDRLGTVHTLGPAGSTDAAREAVRLWIADNVARPAGRAVAVTIDDADGRWHVAVTPTGDAEPSTHGKDRPRRRATSGRPRPATDLPPAPRQDHQLSNEPASTVDGSQPEPALPAAPAPEADPEPAAPTDVPDPATPPSPAGSGTHDLQRPYDRPERPSFITAGRTVQPAQEGWRGALNKLGLRFGPGPDELAMRSDVEAVSQHWGGPRTIAVVNGKGSASKTPTTACLAAVFARYGGAGAIAWDNNETRGSLAWRTEGAPHKATVLDLLPRADVLMAPTAQYAEMANYVHHQAADKYDVLWSDQSVSGEHIVTAEDVHQVHQVAARYYRLIVMDSGNSERAPNWRAMVERADRLVVPCTNVEDTAEAGARLIEALATRGSRAAQLARDAVVIVSQRTSTKDPNLDRIVAGYRNMGMTVVTIPYDPALQTGVIRWDSFRPPTQRAWLRAAAEVARGL